MEKTKDNKKLTGYRRTADMAFGYLALLFAALGFVQIFLAGYGTFGGSFNNHEILGNVLAVSSLLLLILAVAARRSAITIVGAIVLVLLADGAQHGLASAGWDNPWLGAGHALSGLIVITIAGFMGSKVLRIYKK